MTVADPALLADVRGYLADADAIILALARDRDSYRAIAIAALAQLHTLKHYNRELREEIRCRTDKWVGRDEAQG